MAAYLRAVTNDFNNLAPDLYRLLRARYFESRRLPMILPPAGLTKYDLYFQAEHAPNRNSRVSLSHERDALGMPRLEVKPPFSALDIDSVVGCHRLLANQFLLGGVGHVIYL